MKEKTKPKRSLDLFRVDDRFDEHPKMVQVGPLGMVLWVASLAYCHHNKTDGFIPLSDSKILIDFDGLLFDSVQKVTPSLVCDILVTAGLWERCTEKGLDGYFVHDDLDYQPGYAL